MTRLRLRAAAVMVAIVVGGAVLIGGANAASAHPLGNFTVNQYSGLRVTRTGVDVDLVVDFAEIPTFQERVSAANAVSWRDRECATLRQGLTLSVDGRAAALAVGGAQLVFPPGQGGLPTMRLSCQLHAAVAAAGQHRVQYHDGNFEGRIGWREVTAVGDGARLVASDVPAVSVSARLTSYPQDLLRSPLDQRSAMLRVAPGGAAASGPSSRPEGRVTTALPRGVDRATRAFTTLVARHHLTVPFALVALGLGIVLGAIHALAPGHAKTVMAAYLVGQRGSLRQASLIGLTVTATHTAGVLVLGLVLSTSALVAPERLYPWLGLTSGLLLASIGLSLLRRAARVRRAARHEHEHDHHDHDHAHDDGHQHEHVHSHGGRAHSHGPLDAGQPLTWRGLVTMGFAGGMVPSPSALVVLLGAIALGRAWFGLALVVAYGAGMALTLTGAGLLLVRCRQLLDRRGGWDRGRVLVRVGRLLPVGSAAVIVVAGLGLAVRGAAAI